MTTFSSYKRQEIIDKIEETSLDLLVIGGGITGSGIALDAVTRGLNTAVVEMQDFAAGTSSRSTKLVHGGLRYLKQFEVGLVAEVGKERAIVYENGPHVTTPEWMLLPFHKGGTFGPFTTNIGLRVYDFLAGVKKNERRKMLSPKEALKTEPLIKEENLRGAGYYVEYKTDDARLTIEVMKKAVQKGAYALNHAKVIDFLTDDAGKLTGVIVEDQITEKKIKIFAKKIINAGGPWVDQIRELDEEVKGKRLQLTKGVHLVFSNEVFPLRQAIYFDTPDGRMIFAIPRAGKTYVGTTDTPYQGDIANPTITAEDREYILDAIRYMFPTIDLTQEDIESSWSGLRPLIAAEGKKPGEISRKEEIFISDSGLISMAGGKLTGYRKMAEEAVDTVVKQFKEDGILYDKSSTKDLPIAGGEVGGSYGFSRFKKRMIEQGMVLNISEDEAEKLISTYGANVEKVYEYIETAKENMALSKVIYAQLKYAIEEEMAYKPTDFFVRRTGRLFFDIESVVKYKDAVLKYMKEALHWNDDQTKSYTEEMNRLIDEAKNAETEK